MFKGIGTMFGGYGVYCGDLFFALTVDEVLYLKADDESRGLFEAEQLPPFTYDKQGKTAVIRYYQAPDLIFDDEEALRYWGNLALGAALRARKLKALTPKKTILQKTVSATAAKAESVATTSTASKTTPKAGAKAPRKTPAGKSS